ncbi:hypothetical protein H4S02_005131, partial [Coemansia sp. RSA 2611]
MTTYPAKQHFVATAARLGADTGVILVYGSETLIHPDSDTEYEFHQNSNFYYLSGVAEPGFAAAYDIGTRTAILFVPHVSADEAVWIGVPPSLEEYRAAHGFDAAHYTKDISEVIGALKPSVVFTLPENASACNAYSLAPVEKLRAAVHEARVYKDDYEIEVMRRANQISSAAHVTLMREARQGMIETELRGRFVGLVLAQGCSYEAYGSIVAKGRNAAV